MPWPEAHMRWSGVLRCLRFRSKRGALPRAPYRLSSRSCSAPPRPIRLGSPVSQVSQRAGCAPALEGRRMVPLTDSMAPAQSVLIIDDEAVNRRLAQVMFQKLGWEVETVDSGDRALLHLAAR